VATDRFLLVPHAASRLPYRWAPICHSANWASATLGTANASVVLFGFATHSSFANDA